MKAGASIIRGSKAAFGVSNSDHQGLRSASEATVDEAPAEMCRKQKDAAILATACAKGPRALIRARLDEGFAWSLDFSSQTGRYDESDSLLRYLVGFSVGR